MTDQAPWKCATIGCGELVRIKSGLPERYCLECKVLKQAEPGFMIGDNRSQVVPKPRAEEITVGELMEKLSFFGLESKVKVLAMNRGHTFSLSWSGPEGVTKATAECVYIDVDELNQREAAG